MSININNNQDNHRNVKTSAIIGGCLAGSTVAGLINVSRNRISSRLFNIVDSINKNLPEDTLQKMEQAVADKIKNSRLAEKGVEIVKASNSNPEKIKEIFMKEFNHGLLKYLPNNVKKFMSKVISLQVTSGKNAYYTPFCKKILIPEKKLRLAIFHETGHAINANLSKIGKVLQKFRALKILAIPISIIALLKQKKESNEEPKNKLDKATTFIKNNAGKLTFATFLPILIEEGLASINGHQIAKKILSPELLKKVLKTNTLGYLSYLTTGLVSAVGVSLGVKVKDAIAKPKPINENKKL